MPTELPPGHKPDTMLVAPPIDWVSRTLNWTALFVGLGLCFWVINYGVDLQSYPNSPSLAAVSSSTNK
jgi:hypothetical protein